MLGASLCDVADGYVSWNCQSAVCGVAARYRLILGPDRCVGSVDALEFLFRIADDLMDE